MLRDRQVYQQLGKFKEMGQKLGNVSKCAKNWKIQLEFEKVCQKGRRHDKVCKKIKKMYVLQWKVWESRPKAQKVWENRPKIGKSAKNFRNMQNNEKYELKSAKVC